jgi:hypothetical protein
VEDSIMPFGKLMLAVGMTLSVAAYAHGPYQNAPGQGMGPGMMQGYGWGGMLDRDGDGRISAEEAALRHETLFHELDADGDGVLSEEEFMADWAGAYGPRQQRREAHRRERFGQLDGNGDGQVDQGEFMAAGREHYQQLDTDGDGQVDVWSFRGHRRPWQ